MKDTIQPETNRKKSILKKLLMITLIIPVLAIIIIVIAAIQLGAGDPSPKSPIYTGGTISDSLQNPLKNEFGHFTTAMEVIDGVDLKGKNIVITAGHTGTGLEATKAFVKAGAHVIVLARETELAKENLKGLKNVDIEYFDLLKPATIDSVAQKIVNTGKPIHLLINSAALFNAPLKRDSRGYEYHFATNVLGHYELTLKLLPSLIKANGARIVNLSSRGHRIGGVVLDDVNFNKTEYANMKGYGHSKTALSLLSVKEDALFKRHNIRVFAVHPGPIPSTDMFGLSLRGFEPEKNVKWKLFTNQFVRTMGVTKVSNWIRRPKNLGDMYKTVEQGAATTVWAAVSSQLDDKGGIYLEDCNIAPLVSETSTAPFGVRPWAVDKQKADKLWEICAQMTGIHYMAD